MNSIPNVSIIITNFNYGQYIERCVRSCLSQKFVTTETIIVDDASTDESLSLISRWANKIKVISLHKNVGVAAASNEGFMAATAQFVVRVDADDYVTSDFCYILHRAAEMNNNALGVSCDAILVDDNENIVGRRSAGLEPFSCGILYRRDILLMNGGYSERMRHREEEELRKRLGSDYVIINIPMTLYRYRRHSSNKTLSTEYEKTTI